MANLHNRAPFKKLFENHTKRNENTYFAQRFYTFSQEKVFA